MLPWCHGLRSILDFHWSFPVDGAGIGRREGSFGVRTSGGARRPRRGYSPHHIVFVLRLQFSSRHTILSPLRPPAVQGLHGDASVPRERGATEATTMIAVKLEYSRKIHVLTEDGRETLCGIPESQIRDGGGWWYVENSPPTCRICAAGEGRYGGDDDDDRSRRYTSP